MNSESWEILKTQELKKEIKKLRKNQILLNKKLVKSNKLSKKILYLLLENKEFSKNTHLENKVHTKNIRDMLEMFSDLKPSDNNTKSSEPFTVSRMHNRMWRHSIKNYDDIKDIQDSNLMGIYKEFNSK